MDNEWSTFLEKWKTHPQKKDKPLNLKPNMVFSIIGDSDNSLILYEGRKTGISRVVYEAFKKRYRLDFYNDEGKSNEEKKITTSPLIQLLGIPEKKDDSKEAKKNSNTEQKDKFEDSVYEMIYNGNDYNNFMILLRRRAPLLFGTSFKEQKLKDLVKCMEAIKNRQWLINVFNLNTDDPDLLSQIAGEAIICGWSMENIAVPGTEKNRKNNWVTYMQLLLNLSNQNYVKDLFNSSSVYEKYILSKKIVNFLTMFPLGLFTFAYKANVSSL
ncbi:hypothetical protein KUTeg_001814 [Tegillarca granosa]|uniref:Uncharacterized protein n=1 Tax=Tegillarca granosa TaxID=220873 RepID=A0ABQ9FSI5_TEGGR|nr:hypothetical protein KUTeg_001814 [Tegillarca granosa]